MRVCVQMLCTELYVKAIYIITQRIGIVQTATFRIPQDASRTDLDLGSGERARACEDAASRAFGARRRLGQLAR